MAELNHDVSIDYKSLVRRSGRSDVIHQIRRQALCTITDHVSTLALATQQKSRKYFNISISPFHNDVHINTIVRSRSHVVDSSGSAFCDQAAWEKTTVRRFDDVSRALTDTKAIAADRQVPSHWREMASGSSSQDTNYWIGSLNVSGK